MNQLIVCVIERSDHLNNSPIQVLELKGESMEMIIMFIILFYDKLNIYLTNNISYTNIINI